MKIKLKIDAYGGKAGRVIEVSPVVAERLIRDGDAEPVDVPADTENKRVKARKIENKAVAG